MSSGGESSSSAASTAPNSPQHQPNPQSHSQHNANNSVNVVTVTPAPTTATFTAGSGSGMGGAGGGGGGGGDRSGTSDRDKDKIQKITAGSGSGSGCGDAGGDRGNKALLQIQSSGGGGKKHRSQNKYLRDNTWRQSLPCPTEKLGHILANEMYADLKFSVGDSNETISCHKLILAMSSPVFEAMLMGPLAHTDGEVIRIPDVDPQAFKLLLKFIYTGEVTASIQNAVDLMYASKKYDISELTLKCSELLRSDLTEKNSVTILQAAQLLDDKDLERKAEVYLIRHFAKVIEEQEDFVNMSKDNLKHFLKKDELDVNELDLFNAVIKWSESECLRREFEEMSIDKKKLVLQDVIPLVRFPLITAEDFSLHVVPTNILGTDESLCILQYLAVSKDKRLHLPSLPFNSKTRNTNSVYTAHFAVRLTDMVYPYVSHISYFDSFEVDQPINLVSVGFPAPDMDDASYDVAVQIQVQGSNILTAQTNQSIIGKRRSVMRVNFDQPVKIEPNVLYKVVYKLKGPDTYYADQRIERFPVRSRRLKSVNFRYIAYSCRLIEISFIF